jgi:hypothetical protein
LLPHACSSSSNAFYILYMRVCAGALFSFNLALNDLDEYEGGGTYFRSLEGSGDAAALRSPKVAYPSPSRNPSPSPSTSPSPSPNANANPSPSPDPCPNPNPARPRGTCSRTPPRSCTAGTRSRAACGTQG